MRHPVSIRIQLLLFAALILLAMTIWSQRQEVSTLFAKITEDQPQKQNNRDRALPVVVKHVATSANNDIIEALGTGRAKRFITIYPEVAGEITALNVSPGQQVTKGDVILTLDKEDAELAKKVAETKVLEARRLAKRSSELRRKNINSKANVDDAATRLLRAELELDQARESLADRQIIAPFTGIIGIPRIEPGDRVTTTTELMTLDDRSELIIEFEVPEIFLSRLALGNNIAARTPTYADKAFQGTIAAIDSRIDPANRSIKVRALLPNSKDLLRPGMSFSTKVTLKGDTYPLIPELALVWSKGKSYVWKIEKNKAVRISVTIIKRQQSTLLVKGDLKKGDLVVVEGLQRLKDGSDVSYENPDQPLSH